MTPPDFTSHPLTQILGPTAAARLAACVREVRFDSGAYIFRDGDIAETLYLIHAGTVWLEQPLPGEPAAGLERLGAGDVLGLSWLFPQAHWRLDARCLGAVTAFALPAECVRAVVDADPGLDRILMTHLVQTRYQRLVRLRLQQLARDPDVRAPLTLAF